jgi:FKBP-type peptidyl-prolyl cis-trans isomerase 2
MAMANKGDTVKIHYTGRLDDGTVFDSSEGREPLSFELGKGEVIPGFETAVEGMEAGDQKTAQIPADEAYGPRRDDLLITVPRGQLPDDMKPEVGQQLRMQTAEGRSFVVQVTEVGPEELEVDANHPLAGRDLTFEIELVGIG